MMDEKTLNNLNITQLRTLLLSQQQELETLKAQLQELQSRLDDRQLAVEEAGSIAQAALQLSGIFENAQQAANHYLENVELLHARQEADYLQRLAEAEQQAQDLLQTTKQHCHDLEQAARIKADYYWEVLSHKIARLYQGYPELVQTCSGNSVPAEDPCFGPDD